MKMITKASMQMTCFHEEFEYIQYRNPFVKRI